MEKKFFGFMAFAILIEAIVTYFKDFFLKGDNIWQMVICITLGIIIAISYSLDIPEMLGLESKYPYIGSIITGIILSRGSNYLFDILKKITNFGP